MELARTLDGYQSLEDMLMIAKEVCFYDENDLIMEYMLMIAEAACFRVFCLHVCRVFRGCLDLEGISRVFFVYKFILGVC